MNSTDDNELDLLAGEYVLGVLSLQQREEFEEEMQRNPRAAALAAAWSDRLLRVAPSPSPVEPAADLWQRIERNLPGKTSPEKFSGIWDSLLFWRIGGMVSMAATVMLVVHLMTMQPEAAGLQYLAVLQASNQGAHWIVEINASDVRLRPLGPVALEAGKSIQFWTKPEGADQPTSLGLVPADRPTVISIDRLPGLGQNQLFEVTLEPEGGSPLGRPTGPILAVGKAVHL
jgi:anti-sigma-K factor RskA